MQAEIERFAHSIYREHLEEYVAAPGGAAIQ